MSVAVSSWVWKHSKVGGGDKLLLLAIADCCDDNGDNAWPSISTLAEKATVSERTVQRRIEVLERLGCLVVNRGAGRGGTHRYTVLMDAAASRHPEGLRAVDKPVENPVEGVTDRRGDNLTGVTQLCRPGGDTQVSPERPERPSTPNPRTAGACNPSRPVHATGCRPCGTNKRAVAKAAAAQITAECLTAADVPPCGHPDCDPISRWRSTPRGEARCPDCHPQALAAAGVTKPKFGAQLTLTGTDS